MQAGFGCDARVNASKRFWSGLFLELGMFSILTASIGLLWRDNLSLLMAVIVQASISLLFWHDRFDAHFFIVITVFGTIAELAFVHFGVWQYANPTLLGIPVWFPPAFGTAALTAERLVRTMMRGYPDLQAESPEADFA
jgi:uncharacterized membrane protein YoaT (DUF817 family)